jgi:hypothetical protein
LDSTKLIHNQVRRKAVVICMMVIIAGMHFVTGPQYRGPFPGFVNGYLMDILVPLGFYFLLTLVDLPLIRLWIFRAVMVLVAASCVEIAQSLGIEIFGSYYDPLDFVMYAIGVVVAAVLDRIVFPGIFGFWKT